MIVSNVIDLVQNTSTTSISTIFARLQFSIVMCIVAVTAHAHVLMGALYLCRTSDGASSSS